MPVWASQIFESGGRSWLAVFRWLRANPGRRFCQNSALTGLRLGLPAFKRILRVFPTLLPYRFCMAIKPLLPHFSVCGSKAFIATLFFYGNKGFIVTSFFCGSKGFTATWVSCGNKGFTAAFSAYGNKGFIATSFFCGSKGFIATNDMAVREAASRPGRG